MSGDDIVLEDEVLYNGLAIYDVSAQPSISVPQCSPQDTLLGGTEEIENMNIDVTSRKMWLGR